jgi:hypothetical protein
MCRGGTDNDSRAARVGERLRSDPNLAKLTQFCGLGVPCAVMDTHLNIHRCNRECGRLFGMNDVEMLERGCTTCAAR